MMYHIVFSNLMPPPATDVGVIMFSVCLAVCPWVRAWVRACLRPSVYQQKRFVLLQGLQTLLGTSPTSRSPVELVQTVNDVNCVGEGQYTKFRMQLTQSRRQRPSFSERSQDPWGLRTSNSAISNSQHAGRVTDAVRHAIRLACLTATASAKTLVIDRRWKRTTATWPQLLHWRTDKVDRVNYLHVALFSFLIHTTVTTGTN